jgi:hypothetical protein
MDLQETTPKERKPYAEPELIEYGDLETLTQAGGGGGTDKVNPSQQG